MEALGTIISFLLFRPLVWAGDSCSNDNSEYGFALVDHVYRSFFADRLVSCYMSCSMQPACQSLNYNLADKTCEFNNDTKHFRPKYFVEKPTYVYADNPDSGAFLFLSSFFFFLTYFLENNSYFLYFVLFSPSFQPVRIWLVVAFLLARKKKKRKECFSCIRYQRNALSLLSLSFVS